MNLWLMPVLIASVVMIYLGVGGLVYHKNMVKMLLSLEVSFNGFLLLTLYAALSFSGQLLGSSLVILAIGVAVAEIAVIISALIYMFRHGMLSEASQEEIEE